jgi:pyruvate/2-oxoglutarate dehydrogenase complex dihydrolipoamide acyltransferase (E2) component
MTEVLFPPLSKEAPDSEGVLATWYAADGGQVVEDQLIAEVQVDKVSADVVAPATGVLHRLVAEDAVVRQGDPSARSD